MNKQSIAFKLRAFSIVIIALIIFSIIYSYVVLYKINIAYPTANKGRLLTNSAKTDIENAFAEKKYDSTIKCDFKYAAADLKGRILMSSIDEYKKNPVVNLHDFSEYDSRFALKNPNLIRYSEPLIVNDAQVGTVIFLIPKEQFLPEAPGLSTISKLIPIIISMIIISILTIHSCLYVKKNVLAPLAELNESACRILKGDYSYRIKYDYDTEVGMFCHDFEAMRDELKYSKEMEAAIKANEKELLACISHDIKTPLAAINGYVSGIKDGIVKDKKGIESYCEVILKRVKMLSKLLEDILEHSKAELNKLNIVFTEFYSEEFFRDILNDLSVEIESKGLKFNVPDSIPNILINADKKRISQVLYNLVSNSIKYSSEGGIISVCFEIDKNYLKVYVKDTGMGIGSADIPYIFNKFYRGEKSRNQKIPGSGLGLSISKYIIEAHGGFVNCEESSNCGTTMSFSIPK